VLICAFVNDTNWFTKEGGLTVVDNNSPHVHAQTLLLPVELFLANSFLDSLMYAIQNFFSLSAVGQVEYKVQKLVKTLLIFDKDAIVLVISEGVKTSVRVLDFSHLGIKAVVSLRRVSELQRSI
jgi:hypothetical protein